MEQPVVSFYTQLSFISSGKKKKKIQILRKMTNMFFLEKKYLRQISGKTNNSKTEQNKNPQHTKKEERNGDFWCKMTSVSTKSKTHELSINYI